MRRSSKLAPGAPSWAWMSGWPGRGVGAGRGAHGPGATTSGWPGVVLAPGARGRGAHGPWSARYVGADEWLARSWSARSWSPSMGRPVLERSVVERSVLGCTSWSDFVVGGTAPGAHVVVELQVVEHDQPDLLDWRQGCENDPAPTAGDLVTTHADRRLGHDRVVVVTRLRGRSGLGAGLPWGLPVASRVPPCSSDLAAGAFVVADRWSANCLRRVSRRWHAIRGAAFFEVVARSRDAHSCPRGRPRWRR